MPPRPRSLWISSCGKRRVSCAGSIGPGSPEGLKAGDVSCRLSELAWLDFSPSSNRHRAHRPCGEASSVSSNPQFPHRRGSVMERLLESLHYVQKLIGRKVTSNPYALTTESRNFSSSSTWLGFSTV